MTWRSSVHTIRDGTTATTGCFPQRGFMSPPSRTLADTNVRTGKGIEKNYLGPRFATNNICQHSKTTIEKHISQNRHCSHIVHTLFTHCSQILTIKQAARHTMRSPPLYLFWSMAIMSEMFVKELSKAFTLAGR